MEQNKFIKCLESVAILRRVKAPRDTNTKLQEGANDIFRNGKTFLLDKDNNSTWAYEIKRLKPIIKPCEDCGVECKDRKVSHALYQFPKRHWRRHCNGCNRVWNPETKQFDLLPMKAQSHFVTFFKKQG
jgi:hypothetical protein